MARTVYALQQRRERLAEQIAANLDLLIGSVSTKGPKRPGHNLTFKLRGVTRTRHIRKEDLEKVRLMARRHRKLKRLIQQLSDLNWRILTLQSDSENGTALTFSRSPRKTRVIPVTDSPFRRLPFLPHPVLARPSPPRPTAIPTHDQRPQTS